MEKLMFNHHYLANCYIEFYNKDIDINKLTKKLESFGYKNGSSTITSSEVKRYIFCEGGYYFFTGFEELLKDKYIKCETYNSFLGLAALRDDVDKNQWFTDGLMWEKVNDYLPSKYMQLEGHKATIEEIIKYFDTVVKITL
jgi:hypothetical protein